MQELISYAQTLVLDVFERARAKRAQLSALKFKSIADRETMRLFRRSPDHPVRRWLWQVGSWVGLVVVTFVTTQAISRAIDPSPLLSLGGDFVPAYSAGKLVREGKPTDIYNLEAMAKV